MKSKHTEQKRIVIDTKIVISAVISKNSIPTKVLETIRQKNILSFSTQEILEEMKGVIAKKKLKIPYKLQQSIIKFFKKHTIIIDTATKIEYCRDPDDNKFLECAIECKADFLISGDQDLLTLKQIRKTKIVSPKEFLKLSLFCH